MTPPPNDHTLNACLARVIGVEIHEGVAANAKYYWHINPAHERQCWSPVTCPIQMEEVEAWLREHGYDFSVTWSKCDGHYTVEMYLNPNPSGDPSTLYRHVMDIDKKRAFALAIYAMEQSQKEK